MNIFGFVLEDVASAQMWSSCDFSLDLTMISWLVVLFLMTEEHSFAAVHMIIIWSIRHMWPSDVVVH